MEKHDTINTTQNVTLSPEKGRYVLYISYFCPFAHRTILALYLKGLESIVQLVILDPEPTANGWFFSGRFGTAKRDPLYDFKYLKDLYVKADPDFTGRATVPMLWDRKTETVVSTDSVGITRAFYYSFDDFLSPELREPRLPGGGFYPEHLREEIDELNATMQTKLNSRVYSVGLAPNQEAYNAAIDDVFGTLDDLEYRLKKSNGPFLFGEFLTESDLRLYPTIARFDVAYYPIFKCNLRLIRLNYPAIDLWYRRLYYDRSSRTRGAFQVTTDFFAEKFGYTKYFALKTGARGDIVPAGPTPAILPLKKEDELDT